MTTRSASRLPVLLTCAALLLLTGKVVLAARLDLYSDEIFYWLASTRLALAYSDLPFMTSLLVGLGSLLEPGSTLAVRALFLALGSSMPLLVYWLALPVAGRSDALLAALLSLCIPLGGFLGLLAVPDVPLLFFGLLSIGLFERALRSNHPGYWAGTGLAVALGLCTHYRFLLYPAAGLLFLLAFRPEYRQWRNPRFWMACAIASLGLAPVLWFNLSHQLASASFYLVERHPWSFQASGLLHIVKQAGLVTPPLYLLLGLTLWRMLQLARDGERSAALLASFALLNLLVYLLLAPWTDSSSTSIHWPLSGYFPLLVYAPATLRAMAGYATTRWHEKAGALLARGVPVLGYCGSLLALIAIGSQAFHDTLRPWTGAGVLSNKMAGWQQFSDFTAALRDREFTDTEPVLVSDNYYTAAQLAFSGLARQTYTVDTDKSVRDGRRLQLELWNMTEAALPASAGSPALFITEDSTLTLPDQEAVLASMCRQVADLQQIASLSLFDGDKRFTFYAAKRLVQEEQMSAYQQRSCPYPARAWIDPPLAGSTLSGVTHIEGWAYKEDIGIRSVSLLLNGKQIADLNYGIRRPDVVQVMAVSSDPNAPDLGFAFDLDTRTLDNGDYTLAIRLVDSRGVVSSYGERPVTVAN